jgi:hypothetical protein
MSCFLALELSSRRRRRRFANIIDDAFDKIALSRGGFGALTLIRLFLDNVLRSSI